MRSRKPETKAFQRWVTHEVLPSIRKRGGYMVEVPNETPEQTMARAILIARDTIERQRADIDMLAGENAALAPKAAMADAFLDADGAYTITQASGLLRQLDGSMSRRRLFQLLRTDRMMEQRTNRATARAVERGYLTNIDFTYPFFHAQPPWRCAAHPSPSTVETGGALRENKYSGRK